MIELLRKSGVALLVLGLALIAQIPHAAHVFDRAPYIGQTVQPDSAWYALLLAYAYAIALESATLMFVVHGRQRASYGFALASFAVNLSYYSMHKVALFSLPAIPVWLLSALLPIAIASYSHILTGAQDVSMQVPRWALRAWAKMRAGVTSDTVQPVMPPVIEPVHNDPDNALCTVDDAVQDGAPDKEDKPAYARWLKMEKGMSNSAIADMLEVHRNTVGGWLNGHSKVAA